MDKKINKTTITHYENYKKVVKYFTEKYRLSEIDFGIYKNNESLNIHKMIEKGIREEEIWLIVEYYNKMQRSLSKDKPKRIYYKNEVKKILKRYYV